MVRLRRRLLYAIAAGLFVSLFALTIVVDHLFTDGTLHVVAPMNANLIVRLDGEHAVALPKGAHAALRLRRGEHTVSVESDETVKTSSFRVTGGHWKVVMRSAPEQCFVRMHVTRAYYVRDRTCAEWLPPIAQRYDGEQIEFGWFQPPVFFEEAELSKPGARGGSLMRQVPCAELARSDKDLVRLALGNASPAHP